MTLLSKTLNKLHLTVLANFSEIFNIDEQKDVDSESQQLLQDSKKHILMNFRSFFKKSTLYVKSYEEFKKIKFEEIEIHLIITRIGVIISKEPLFCFHLVDNTSLFIYDIINFLHNISKAGYHNRRNFIISFSKNILLQKSLLQAGIMFLNIVINTTVIVINIFCSPQEILNNFVQKVEILLFNIIY